MPLSFSQSGRRKVVLVHVTSSPHIWTWLLECWPSSTRNTEIQTSLETTGFLLPTLISCSSQNRLLQKHPPPPPTGVKNTRTLSKQRLNVCLLKTRYAQTIPLSNFKACIHLLQLVSENSHFPCCGTVNIRLYLLVLPELGTSDMYVLW